jgi:hypothetical protein
MKIIKSFVLFLLVLILAQACEQKYPMKIGENYFLNYDGPWGYAWILDSINIAIIDIEIVAWNYDSTFIIAKQKPFRSIFDSIRTKYPNTSLTFRDKLYKGTKIYYYWIIDKRKPCYFDEENCEYIKESVEGPFTREKYWEKRRELGVPDSLRLLEAEKGKGFDDLFYFWYGSPRERVVE